METDTNHIRDDSESDDLAPAPVPFLQLPLASGNSSRCASQGGEKILGFLVMVLYCIPDAHPTTDWWPPAGVFSFGTPVRFPFFKSRVSYSDLVRRYFFPFSPVSCLRFPHPSLIHLKPPPTNVDAQQRDVRNAHENQSSRQNRRLKWHPGSARTYSRT